MEASLWRRFADRLFAIHPQWRAFVRPCSYGVWPFVVEVPAPGERDCGPLRVEGDDSGLIIFFDAMHAHIGRVDEPGEEVAHEKALRLVAAILVEDMVAWSAWAGNQLAEARFLSRAELRQAKRRKHARAIRLRSWRGTYDAELPPL